ncbi:DUF1570 domain-containing protein [Parerythrobacter aestuarii]|uniref:DUF1570 domain-containing protein n=1 Tax=Parerythrobacter aestuarii TaxID=3020909 RepID=UPI0024DE354B|nr:DUF1570 domain-containing protein [Parerythrobacter aestuarii]
MSRLIIAVAPFLLLFNWSAPALADWRVAESDNFVIYAEDSEKDLRKFALMLESYHSAMEFVTGNKIEKPSPSNRVTIYVAGDQRDIRRLARTRSRYLQGFYIARASGSMAFVQDIRGKGIEPSPSMRTLLHEYAHHFLISSMRFGMPRWLSEGAAEFYAASRFPKDGSVDIGRPANHRAAELAYAEDVSVHELLDPELYAERRSNKYDEFYGKSWALYHYLTFSRERSGQIGNYWRTMMTGKSSPEAAREVFGDIDALDKEVSDYVKQRRMFYFGLKPEQISTGPITVRTLSEGAGEVLPLRMISKRGVTEEEATELVVEIREVAAKYPDEPFVLEVLAEAEYDVGNDDAAIAAADKAIALDPTVKNAYVQKGYALFRKAEDADDRDAAYAAAMEPFSKLNKLEKDHPLPLYYYYLSFLERGAEPPEQAKHALERAAQLAPFDQNLWLNVGFMQASEGQIALARFSLQPLAVDPHGGSRAEYVQGLVDALAKAPEGEPFDLSRVIAIPRVEVPGPDDVDKES